MYKRDTLLVNGVACLLIYYYVLSFLSPQKKGNNNPKYYKCTKYDKSGL